jgi:hypothetical protein
VAVVTGEPHTGGMLHHKAPVLAALATAATVAVSSFAAVPAASADPGLAGRWVSDSLRDNRIGYFMVLREAPGRAPGYVGHLRFERQDGGKGVRMPVAVTFAGGRVIITAREGRFDRAGRTISGQLVGRGSLTLTNCLDRLQQVMSWDLASDCTLRLRG